MQPNALSEQSDSGRLSCRLLLPVGLPVLLLLAFLGKQFINFDGIGWSHGFSHPLMGWDHLVTMLAVGIWAAQLRGQAIWMLPLAFVGVMSLGGLAGAAGIAIPSVEGIILLSCAVFSVLITRKVRFSSKINVLIVAFFAFFHGFAHGQEISTSASLMSYTLGFMLATLLLHGAGILVAKLVIFGITCLLTVMFSSAALAKTSAASIDDSLNMRSNGLHPASHVCSPGDSPGYRDIYAGFADDSLRPENCSGHQASTHNHSDAAKLLRIGLPHFAAHSPQISHNKSINQLDSDGSSFEQTAVHALIHRQAQNLLTPEYRNQGGLDFKHYFPDINHTPGTHLLSNGVGLTSPPLWPANAVTPQVSPAFRNIPIPFIEEPHLHSTIAKFNIGEPLSQANNVDHDHAIHDPGHSLSIAATTITRLIRYFSYSAPFAIPNPGSRQSLAAIPEFALSYRNTHRFFYHQHAYNRRNHASPL